MLAETTKRLFELTPRDWRDHDEVIARSALGTALIACKGVPPQEPAQPGAGSAGVWRRLWVEVDGDPADPGLRDALFYALGIGRPRG